MIKELVLGCVLSAALFSCNQKADEPAAKRDMLTDDLDTTMSPAKDFFQYANGGWIRKNPIPAEQASWGIGNLVVEENLRRLRIIIEKSATANAAKGSAEQKIGDFWATAMDSAKIDAAGLIPLQPQLAKINAITDNKSLLTVIAEFKKIGSSELFSDYVGQDAKKSDVMAYQLGQGGINLPEREYYFKNDSATMHIRDEYTKYIAQILTMSGDDSVAAMPVAKNMLALETKLAQASRKLEDLRDPNKNYNKIAIKDLGKLTAGIDWTNYLAICGVKNVDSVIVGQPEFFKALDNILKTTSLQDWKAYLKFNLINDFANALPDRYGIAAFNFSRLFSGAKERKPRWKRVIQSEEGVMGELLGQLYVKEFFTEKAKKRYEDMVEAMRETLKEHITALTWMSDSTKQKAFAKLASIHKKVGYPEKWKDFSSMDIGRDSYVQNLMNARLWWYNYNFDKLGKPVNRDEWVMFPQTYNAYYEPSNNEIVLPAAQFVVPGYKDEELDDALVYGYAAASTIGHEMTHGFDDEGRQFDAKGNLVSWWTKKDEAEFNKRAEVMVKQFNDYEPIKGYHINGKAALGENIADLGGIVLGVDAFKKTDQYKKGEKINGLTPMQRFFLGYSLGWLGYEREELLRRQLMSDVHAPGKYRVNGPFMDVDEFYSSFNIKPGDPMYRPDSLRVRIW